MGEELTIKINKLNKALNEVLGDSFGGLSDLKRVNLYEINFCLMVMQIDEVKVVLVWGWYVEGTGEESYLYGQGRVVYKWVYEMLNEALATRKEV